MKKYRKIIVTGGIIVAFLLVLIPVRNYYLFLKEPVSNLNCAIPSESVIVIKSKSLSHLFALADSAGVSGIFTNTSSTGYMAMAGLLHSLDSTHNELSNIASIHRTLLCFAADSAGAPSYLILAEIGKIHPNSVKSYFEEILPPGSEIKGEKNNIGNIFSFKTAAGTLWYYSHNGILGVSADRSLLLASLASAQSNNNLMQNKAFARMSDASGKNVDAVILIHNPALFNLFACSDKGMLEFDGSPFSTWSSVDVRASSGKFVMEGFTACSSDSTYLKNQEPADFDLSALLPYESVFVLSQTLSEPLNKTGQKTSEQLTLPAWDSANRCAVNETFISSSHLRAWCGLQVHMGRTTSFFKGNRQAQVLLAEVTNPDSARRMLTPFMKPYSRGIYELTASEITSILWGRGFQMPQKTWCLLDSNLFICAGTAELLQNYAAGFQEQRTFKESDLWKKSKPYLLGKSNITVILNPRICASTLKSKAYGSCINKASVWLQMTNKSNVFCLQYQAGNPMMFTHALLLFEPGRNSYNQSTAKTDDFKTDATLARDNDIAAPKPEARSVIQNGKKTYCGPALKNGNPVFPYFTFSEGVLLAVDNENKIMWTAEIQQPPVGNIYLLPDKSGAFLVCTNNKIWLFNSKGKPITGYPKRIREGISGPVLLTNYAGSSDYRLLFNTNDNQIRNYTLDAKAVEDFNGIKVDGKNKPPQFIRSSGKDYLVFCNKDGKLMFTDRRGRERLKPYEKFRVSAGSQVYENQSNSKGIFLMASQKGKLCYIDADGHVSESKFGDFAENPFFSYFDFDNDKKPDFLFSDDQKLMIYSALKNELASIHPKGVNFSEPIIYSKGDRSYVVVRDKLTGDIYSLITGKKPVKEQYKSDSDPKLIFDSASKKVFLLLTQDRNVVIQPFD